MTKREKFIEVINTFKTVSPSITDIQRRGLLSQAVQNYGLSIEEASDILTSLGLTVGETVNYFEVLGLSIEEIQEHSETTIRNNIEETHEQLYSASLRAGGLPRSDGRSQEQWRNLLNQARETLIDPLKRNQYIEFLNQNKNEQPLEIDNATIHISDIEEASPNEQRLDEVSSKTLQITDVEDTPIRELRYQTIPDDKNIPDGMAFIPAGELRREDQDEDTDDTSLSTESVLLDGFFIDICPVTNEQYMNFLNADPQWSKKLLPKKIARWQLSTIMVWWKVSS